MSSYLRKSTKRTAAPRSSSRERDLWLSPYGQPDALRSSKRDRAQQRAKDRQRAQRIAQKTEAAARERARHRALVAARAASPAPRPRPRRKKPAAAGAPPPGFADFAAALRRVCAYVADASDADLRAVYDGGGREARRAAATLGSACGLAARARRPLRPPDPPDVAFGRRNDRPPASSLRGREDRATRRARSKRVARAARDSVDLLERLMGPASPESPTPAIDRAAAAALRRDPDDESFDVAASPVFEGGEAFDAENPIDPLVADEVEALLAGGVGATDADDAILAGGADIDAILAGSPVEGDDDLLEG